MECVGEMLQAAESHKQSIEKYVKQMRLLFKPWLPPESEMKVPSGVDSKGTAGVGTETASNTSSSPVISAEEQEGVALVDKLLSKAQRARDVQKKLEDSKKTRNRRDPKRSMEDENNKTDHTCSDDVMTSEEGMKLASVAHHATNKGEQLQTQSDKKMMNHKQSNSTKKPDKVPSQVPKQSVRAKPRPGGINKTSSAGSRKSVQSTAPFQTDTRQTSAKLQTTYRATFAKTGSKLPYGSARSGKRPGTVDSASSSSSSNRSSGRNSSSLQDSVKTKHIRDAKVNEHLRPETEHNQELSREDYDNSSAGEGHYETVGATGRSGLEARVADLDLNNSAKTDGRDDNDDASKKEESGAGDCAMFQLMKDGSSLKLPSAYRKALHTNRKLQQKVYTLQVTQKVNAPQKCQQFLDNLNSSFADAETAQVQAQGRLAQQLVDVYDNLHSLLDSLTLDLVNKESSPGVIYRARKMLEYILTKFHETEQLLHSSDFRYLSTLDNRCTSSQQPKVPQPPHHSQSVWYPKRCSYLGSDHVAVYRYKSYKQLEQYMTLVYTAQWLQLQIDLMDETAKTILPLLHSIDPTSSEFLQVLHYGYTLLSTKGQGAPVVVKDSMQDVTGTEEDEEDFDPS